MRPRMTRGIGVLDVLVTLALLALLVWLVRMDWANRRQPRAAPATAVAAS